MEHLPADLREHEARLAAKGPPITWSNAYTLTLKSFHNSGTDISLWSARVASGSACSPKSNLEMKNRTLIIPASGPIPLKEGPLALPFGLTKSYAVNPPDKYPSLTNKYEKR